MGIFEENIKSFYGKVSNILKLIVREFANIISFLNEALDAIIFKHKDMKKPTKYWLPHFWLLRKKCSELKIHFDMGRYKIQIPIDFSVDICQLICPELKSAYRNEK